MLLLFDVNIKVLGESDIKVNSWFPKGLRALGVCYNNTYSVITFSTMRERPCRNRPPRAYLDLFENYYQI